ncbi:MAG: hypothetical protein HY841_04080, partial [Bacteroidetes bacterium]|nr:hypothetical protein [Bacteroidota bacterium]
MITHTKILRGIFLMAVLAGQEYASAATQSICATRIETKPNPVIVGAPNASTTANFLPYNTGSFADIKVEDIIMLAVDPHYPQFFSAPMDVKVTFQITTFDPNDNVNPTQPSPVTLEVKYHPFDNLEYRDKEVHRFTNVYKYTVTITDIQVSTDGGLSYQYQTTLPANLYIDACVNVERYYDFSFQSSIPIILNSIDSIDLDCDSKYDELEISWPTKPGAEEYQLEWTFVNDYNQPPPSASFFSPSNLKYDFRGNSTRITTANINYRIPIIFDHGYLLFRVRAIGRVMNNPSQIIVGFWSVIADQGTVNNVSSRYYVWDPHERDKNWQVTTTFAEEGKKKEVISYFDGTLRNRQTVTKINTDKNTIVGETIYDHQGRPSVTVLPVPVPAPVCTNTLVPIESVIKFYPDFNKNAAATDEYSRDDFDVDKTASPCSSDVAGMSISSGASNYYSPQNPSQSDFQAFVPDAKKFPFTQVEYTPDNTGRIRRQGGVGEEFQLDDGSGTKHETKYFYGQPNQIQLDRLFGSEMGDATHYKKNVVVDANNQHSVSYLDQEGRVIATSLAGAVPTNLDALPSALPATKTFTVDAFAKDANGVSQLNTVNVSQTGIDFSTQLLVTYASTYTFSYDLKIDTLKLSCDDTARICFNCVYDLEIKVSDECGQNLAVVGKKVGKLVNSSGVVVFNAQDCSSPSQFTQNENFQITLTPGVYTVSKLLTIDVAVRDSFINAYLDSMNNYACVKTLFQFQQDALSKIDTSDCYIDCSDCITGLGDRDDYIAKGGTGFDYDREYEECKEMCKTRATLCEISYEQMLSDVSPGGQYAQYLDTINNIVNPALYPLSVLHTGNVLPYGFHPSNSYGDWRNPRAILNNTTYLFYLEEDGTRSTIPVAIDPSQPSGYWPNVYNPNTNIFQNTQGDNFTYPEFLLYAKDFIAAWKPSWAKSLVQYHPEYCYYETCREYSIKQGLDKFTSDSFDSLLIVSENFNDAVANKLIKTNYLSFTDPNDRVTDWFNTLNSPATNPFDPFATNSSAFSPYGNMLQTKFDFYFTNPNNYTMVEAAAMAVRCGKLYGITPTQTCMEFGTDLIPSGPQNINDSIRNLEWKVLRGFYLSAKQQLQNDLADADAIKSPCFALNDCIGYKDYDPATAGMFSIKPPFSVSPPVPPPTASPFPNFNPLNRIPYFDQAQPCGIHFMALYRNKFKRFPEKEDLPPSDINQVAYQMYLQSGQCANAFNLQQLLDALAGKQKLEATGESLLNYAEYNALYLSKHHYAPQQPITSEGYTWNGTAVGNLLTIQWKEPNIPNTTKCVLTLDKTGTGTYNWSDIIGFKDLKALTANTYTVLAVLAGTSSFPSFIYKPISGTISCINIADCFFAPVCTGNDFAKDIASLMSALAATGDLTGIQVALSTSASYSVLVTQRIKNMFGTPNNDMRWTYNSAQQQFIISDPNNSQQITFTITDADPVTFSLSNLNQIKSFSDIRSDFQNFFKVNGRDINGNVMVTLKGTANKKTIRSAIGISMGECGNPTSFNCIEKEFDVRNDLEALLHEALLKKPFNSNINVYSLSNFTSLLQSYLSFDTILPDSSASTEAQSTINNTHYDSLLFIIPKCSPEPCSDSAACRMNLWIHSQNQIATFANIRSLGTLVAKGTPDANGNFHDFCMIACFDTSSTTLSTSFTTLPHPLPILCDTIFGTSCWPIKNCEPCVELEKDTVIGPLPVDTLPHDTVIIGQPRLPIPLDSASIAKQDSVELSTGLLVRDDSPLLFQQYEAVVTETNTSLGLASTDPNYLKAVSYPQFWSIGVARAFPDYLRFIRNFRPLIDDVSLVNSPINFISRYGYGTNVVMEYQRYTTVVTRYNQYAVAFGSTDTLKAISDSSFFMGCFADSLNTYVRYLDSLMTAGDTTQPMDETAFFIDRGIIDTLQDTCSILYENYVQAWRVFQERQNQQTTCLNYRELVPLFSCGDFKRNNLCCSDTGYSLINQYISSLLDTTACPGPLPKLDSCNAISVAEDIRICERLYALYLTILDRYNSSPYASATGNLINTLYPTFSSFHRAGRCKCVRAYLAYLEPYLADPANLTLPPPEDIDHWPGCEIASPLPTDTCEQMTRRFESAITQYNEFAISSIGAAADSTSPTPRPIFPPIIVLPPAEDVLNRFCECVTSIEATVDAIRRGTFDSNVFAGVGQLSIIRICDEFRPPCTPDNPPNDTINMPPVPYSSPCVEYMINTALQNAYQQWQFYMDSLAGVVSANYTAHCLGALENFNYIYDDKEYHFTLYYYDQAGNLVKTVPPEGVNTLTITSSFDPKELKIIADRTNGTRSIDGMTFHNLATTYIYNSLNQLVRQNMPDHDQMDIWETTLPNGLDSRLKITRTQFVNSSDGYLTGYIESSTTAPIVPFTRGYMYKTFDGGATWQKVTDLVAAGFNKVQMFDPAVGYAAGDHGIAMKTSDGGSTWDMLPTYATSITGTNINNPLLDVFFTTNDGIFVGANGLALRTTDGGATFSQITVSPLPISPPSTDTLTSITNDGTNYYVTVKRTTGNRQFAIIYSSANATTWTAATSYRATDLLKVQYYDATNPQRAYAAGIDGNLLWTDDNGINWYAIATGTAGKFKDIYFRNDTIGIAIIENTPGIGNVWKTINGGNTWTLLSSPGEKYNSLHSYEPEKIAAVGKNGLVKRALMTAPTSPNFNMNMAFMTVPPGASSVDFDAVWAAPQSGTNSIIIAAGSNNKIYSTNNGSSAQNSVAWNSPSFSLLAGDLPVKKIEAYLHNSNNVSGIILSNTGKPIYFYYNTSPNFPTQIGVISSLSSGGIEDITIDGTTVYLYHQTNKQLYTVTLADNTSLPSASTLGGASPFTGTVKSITKNGNYILLAGDGGLSWKFDISNVTYTDQSENMKPLALADIKSGGANMYAIGKDGTALKQTAAGKWTQAETGTAENLNGIYFSSTSTGAIAGDNGSLFTFTIPTTGVAVNLTSLISPTSENLNAIAGTSNTIYASGNKGTLLFCQDITNPNVLAGVATTTQDLKGVAILPNTTNAYAVGGKAHVRFCFGQSAFRIKEVFPHRLNGVHFIDPMNGFAVGDKFIARYTSDGGTTWDISLPALVPTSNVPNLKTVYTTKPPTSTTPIKGVTGGTKNFFANISGSTVANAVISNPSSVTFSTANTFYAITFSNSQRGIAVAGEKTNKGRILYTHNGGVSWTVAAPAGVDFSFRAAWAFKRNDWALITGTKSGGNERVKGFDISAGSFITLPNKVKNVNGSGNDTIRDIFFHDDIAGYLVGSRGKVFRSSGFGLDVNLPGFPWENKGSWNSMTANDGLNSQTSNNDLNITSVAFATRYDGFLGGDYNGTIKNYARILHDESNLFSTRFWYDKLGRIVLSQNTRQYGNNANQRKYSYTLYDYLGRVIEAGEKKENTQTTTACNNTSITTMADIFGTFVNNHFNPKVIDDCKLNTWLNGNGKRREVTRTYYDAPNPAIVPFLPTTPTAFVQENLRKRIATVTYEDEMDFNTNGTPKDETYEHATHYTYDIHGNVKSLLQDNQKLAVDNSTVADIVAQRFKRTDYTYDLISGNVHKVDYENNKIDQWHHQYEYDADNRIKSVKTSRDNVIFDKDAKYFYYAHGPLARVELGENKVQGMDYAYTLQGWIKGVNSNTLDSVRDIGMDGNKIPANNLNKIFAADVFGYSLNYFGADYSAIDQNKNLPANNFIADASANTNLAADAPNLFNGNINSMVTAITDPATVKPLSQLMAYKYDQLNRIMQAKAYKDIDLAQNKWNAETYANRYFNSFTYDASGNILTQKRNDENGTAIEDMTYRYKVKIYNLPVAQQQRLQNRLYHVNDAVTATAFDDDIDDMGTFDTLAVSAANNYSYDKEGRLEKDLQEGIANIEWMVTGKVKRVTRTATPVFSKTVNGIPFYPSDLEFNYDALGNRVSKIEKPRNQTSGALLGSADYITTFYVRDAQGNVLSVYKQAAPSLMTSYKQIEKDIYGSSRVGMEVTQTEMVVPITPSLIHILGNKQYEMGNHLGNVLAVVTDKKIPVDISPADGITDYYKAELLVSTDYYPFGTVM